MEKKHVLNKYQTKFGILDGVASSIVSCKRGTHLSFPLSDQSRSFVRPEQDKGNCVTDLNIYHIIAIVFKEQAISFTPIEVTSLLCVNKTFAEVIPKIMRWLSIDFSSLCKLCLDYEAQTTIDNHCVEMASAAMLHFGLHPG